MTKTKSTKRLEPGDLVCGKCGQGNTPTRKFCSRCGDPLTTAQVVKRRWWQRRGKPKSMEAGARPGQKGAGRDIAGATRRNYIRLRNILGVVAVAFAMLVVFVPGLRENLDRTFGHPVQNARQWVSDKWQSATASTETIAPFEVSANEALPQHPPDLAFDNITNTFWAAPWSSKEPFLRIEYKQAQTLVAMVVHPGAPGEDAAKYLRPAELTIKYGSGQQDVVQLPPEGDAITIELKQASTFRVARITVTKVWEKKGLNRVAVSEIELKRKKQ